VKTHRLGLLATAISLSAASWAGAQSVSNWNAAAPGDGSFSNGFVWNPAGSPGTTGEARFNSANSAYTVTFTTDPTNVRMRVGNDHVVFDLNGHTYNLTATDTGTPSIMVAGSTFGDDALLTIMDGTLAGRHAVIAPAIFQTAAGVVVDTGGALNLAGTFTIGKQLPGSLTIQNGGDVTSTTGVLGESGNGNGLVTVTGAGSTWHNTGSVYVGGQAAVDGGNGTLSITNQGLVDIDGALKLWPGGNVVLDGGTLKLLISSIEFAGGSFTWTSGTFHTYGLAVDPSGLFGDSLSVGAAKVLKTDGEMIVGDVGTGSLNISGGGHVQTGVATGSVGEARIGRGTLSHGTVVVSGGDWTEQGEIILADRGVGSLEINNGGVFCADANIGRSPGSNGEALVTGASSRWRVSLGGTAHLIVGGGGSGIVNVASGAEVFADQMFIALGPESNGTVNVDGPGSELVVDKQLEIGVQGVGSLAVTNGAQIAVLSFPTTIGLNGQLSGDGLFRGKLRNTGLLSPGGASPGALTMQEGDYTQTSDGELRIELASASSYDQLLIIDDHVATLAGTLTVNLLDSFVPTPGQSYTILTADDVDGTFATETLPSVPGLIFDVIYNSNSVVVTVFPAFTADFDEDGDVDADDLNQWQGDFGENALSDADNDGDSDGADFLAWQQQFGSPPPPAVAVPELCMAQLLWFEIAALGLRPRRRSP
jgi:T5SS/PEP-CTERM-associated repeat protein